MVEAGVPVAAVSLPGRRAGLEDGEQILTAHQGCPTEEPFATSTGIPGGGRRLQGWVTVDVSGPQIVSAIIRASAERLGLAEGTPVTVFIKATEVLLGVE